MADELVDDMLYAARANDMEELQTGVCHCAIAFPDILEVDGQTSGCCTAIDAGAPIDCRDPNDTTPLMMAAANG